MQNVSTLQNVSTSKQVPTEFTAKIEQLAATPKPVALLTSEISDKGVTITLISGQEHDENNHSEYQVEENDITLGQSSRRVDFLNQWIRNNHSNVAVLTLA